MTIESERFILQKQIDGRMHLVDTLGQFESIPMPDELSKIIGNILWEHYNYKKHEAQGMLKLMLFVKFIKENNDLDKDLLIAIINNCGGDVE